MKALEEKILKDARILDGDVVQVDSFLNHRLETAFLDQLAAEIARYFSGRGINKILTIEASGIALAMLTATHMGHIPVVFAIKKIEDGKLLFNPPVNYAFQINDVLVILGTEAQIDKLRHLGDEMQ